ncbi:MAG TPA: zinc-binding alcohol dehydrogenase family protein [Candidatus Baltobacteraceae bacterium]|nr:zinc-binding alcohol dehydrogenase family protein [Candidatus Baltobacteraceae bacterium]
MKAAVVKAPGAIPEYAEFTDPGTEEGYELVDLVAAGLHPIVRSLAAGRHYGSTGSWPLIPGIDAVARTVAGDLVYTGFVRPPYGTFAQRMAVPKRMRAALPPGADPVQVAGGLNPGLSSWLPLNARVTELGAIGAVLILGVTGMAGSLAVQHARLLGASAVIGVGRNPSALRRAAEFGAKTVALTGDREGDTEALVRALDGAEPSIVLDYLWASAAETAFAALARRGLDEDTANIAYVQIGAMAGPDAVVPAALLRSRRIRISGSGAGSASIADIMAQLPRYLQLIADGKIVVPTQTFALSSISEAWSAPAESARRIVIVP